MYRRTKRLWRTKARKDINMKVSAKGIYAAVVMPDILEYGEASPVVIKEIAAREDLPNKYAE